MMNRIWVPVSRVVLCSCLYLCVVFYLCNTPSLSLSSTSLSPPEKQVLSSEEVLSMLRRRSQLVQRMCSANSTQEQSTQTKIKLHPEIAKYLEKIQLGAATSDLIVMPDRNITWCLIPKVASTSISSALLVVTERKVKSKATFPQKLLREAYPNPSLSKFLRMNKFHSSFYITRHPFVKLVSAYVNKMVNTTSKHDGDFFYQHYGKKIVRNYRKRDEWNTSLELEESTNDTREEPTFAEFVEFLLHTNVKAYDQHWKPVWLLCHVCDFRFEFVVKYEHFALEFQTLVNYFKRMGELPPEFEVKWENKEETGSSGKESVAKRYMKTLSKEKRKQLYHLFEKDFLYFEYSPEGYL